MFSSKNLNQHNMPKMRYFFLSKIRQVLGNPLFLDPRWPWWLGALPPVPCVLIHSFHLNLYQSVQNYCHKK